MCLLAITLLLNHLFIFLAEANNLMQSFKDFLKNSVDGILFDKVTDQQPEFPTK